MSRNDEISFGLRYGSPQYFKKVEPELKQETRTSRKRLRLSVLIEVIDQIKNDLAEKLNALCGEHNKRLERNPMRASLLSCVAEPLKCDVMLHQTICFI